MVGIGILMLALVAWSAWQWRRGRLFESKTVLRAWMLMTPAGFIAVLAGWYTTEIGRQPYVVYGLMRTSEAATAIDAGSVITSLIVFATVYLFVFVAGTYYLLKLLRKGPQPVEQALLHPEDKTAQRPLSLPRRADRGQRAEHGQPDAAAGRLVRDHRVRGADVRADGWLRARHRHPGAVRRGRAAARPHDDTAAPIWDGNETWLVLGGAGLLAAFPKAYAVMLSALYLPVLLMLVALVLRGVSFEFRFKANDIEAHLGRVLRGRLDRRRVRARTDARRDRRGHAARRAENMSAARSRGSARSRC